MPEAAAKLQAYTQTRWSCDRDGVFDRGTAAGKIPSVTCPACGRRSLFIASVNGQTRNALPFHTQPRHPEVENDARHNPRGGNKRNGKSTGRPKSVRPNTPEAPKPAPVRLPGDRPCPPRQ